MVRLAEFLENTKESLNRIILDQFRPLYNFDPSESLKKAVRTLKRPPFPSQTHSIAALERVFESGRRSAFLVGEMGVGKTLIAIASAYFLHFKTVLVMCPPHLVKKWKREIETTISGVSASIIQSITDLEEVMYHLNPNGHFLILSRERAKLSYRWKPAFIYRTAGTPFKYKVLACPSCGSELLDKEGVPLDEKELREKKLKCLARVKTKKGDVVCSSPLWCADNSGPRRYSLAEYIKKRYRNFFELFAIDECHEVKAKGSAQGFAAASLASASKRTLALTGTIFGGYSTSIFHLLYRLSQNLKLRFSHNDELRFAQRYGILERITHYPDTIKEEGATSKRKAYQTRVIERPGISPAIITELLDQTVFLRLADVAEHLPLYEDVIESVDMDSEQKEVYERFWKALKEALNEELRKGSKKLLGAYLQSLLAYPDTPWREESIYKMEADRGTLRPVLAAHAEALSEDNLYPKEKRLIALCQKEKALGRKVGLYVTHTGKRDITGRMKTILERSGLNVSVLKSDTVSSEKREEWIKAHAKEGVDVLVCHPRLVQTGLDLLDFPTLIFYQTEYSVYTLRQASRRSWRCGQSQPVRVHYFVYKDTIQEKALRLVAEKTKTSLAVEGEFMQEGLSSFGQGNDILTDLAKSLIKNDSSSDTAEKLFREARETFFESERFLQEPKPLELTNTALSPAKPDESDKREEEKYLIFTEPNGQQCFGFV